MINTILFDLDGTLLPMDIDMFTNLYFDALSNKLIELNFDLKKMMAGLKAGTKAMLANNGEKTNEIIFWEEFTLVSGMEQNACESDFEQFYLNEFSELSKYVTQSKNMIQAANLLNEKGYRLLLTTNPLFPKIAVEERVRWSGIDYTIFSMVTCYENSHYCKPNIEYYNEVIRNQNLKVEECMMVGNDSFEDGIIETLGIPLFLVDDYLIHRSNDKLTSKWHGSSEMFLHFVEGLPNIKRK